MNTARDLDRLQELCTQLVAAKTMLSEHFNTIKVADQVNALEKYAIDKAFECKTVFRTGIPLPAEIPVGTYNVDIKLLANGALIAKTETAFEIVKVGFEQFVANSARQHGLLYGLATALMALMTGWLASVVFRRD